MSETLRDWLTELLRSAEQDVIQYESMKKSGLVNVGVYENARKEAFERQRLLTWILQMGGGPSESEPQL